MLNFTTAHANVPRMWKNTRELLLSHSRVTRMSLACHSRVLVKLALIGTVPSFFKEFQWPSRGGTQLLFLGFRDNRKACFDPTSLFICSFTLVCNSFVVFVPLLFVHSYVNSFVIFVSSAPCILCFLLLACFLSFFCNSFVISISASCSVASSCNTFFSLWFVFIFGFALFFFGNNYHKKGKRLRLKVHNRYTNIE